MRKYGQEVSDVVVDLWNFNDGFEIKDDGGINKIVCSFFNDKFVLIYD